MADYKEAVVSGQAWHRFDLVEINNGFGRMPEIRIHEERRIMLSDGGSLGTPVRAITRLFTDPSATFDLYNPATGEKIGATMTHGEVYGALYGLCMSLAAEEDAGEQEAQEP
jgi:hypothetical protein